MYAVAYNQSTVSPSPLTYPFAEVIRDNGRELLIKRRTFTAAVCPSLLPGTHHSLPSLSRCCRQAPSLFCSELSSRRKYLSSSSSFRSLLMIVDPLEPSYSDVVFPQIPIAVSTGTGIICCCIYTCVLVLLNIVPPLCMPDHQTPGLPNNPYPTH